MAYRGTSGVLYAIEQRNFVLWWDGQVKDKGAREPGTKRGTTPLQTSNSVNISSLGIDRVTIHRWRKLKDEGGADG